MVATQKTASTQRKENISAKTPVKKASIKAAPKKAAAAKKTAKK